MHRQDSLVPGSDNAFAPLFARLEAFQSYPNYQLERRADAFLAYFLIPILRASSDAFSGIDLSDLEVIPEFPLDQNGNAKADYLIMFPRAGRAILLEFKTDIGSLDRNQIERYESFVEHGPERGWEVLRETALAACTDAKGHRKDKYDKLRGRLAKQPERGVALTLCLLGPTGLRYLVELWSGNWTFIPLSAVKIDHKTMTKPLASLGEAFVQHLRSIDVDGVFADEIIDRVQKRDAKVSNPRLGKLVSVVMSEFSPGHKMLESVPCPSGKKGAPSTCAFYELPRADVDIGSIVKIVERRL